MFTTIILVFGAIGIFRIVKFVANNPDTSLKAGSWLKDAFGK